MTGLQLGGLTARYELSALQVSQLEEILRTLEADEHAPTAVRSATQALDIHLADSLVALELDQIATATTIADIGAGAGFPGLPLAVALPAARVALVESQRRKCDFLMGIASTAGVENTTVVCARAEDWREGLESNDTVVARALAPQPVVLEYAAPLLRPGGSLVDWRGRRDADEEGAALRAAEILGLELAEIRRVEPFEGATDRHVHVFSKVAATPERFPRRAGMARKRPLGG
ncbi:MAG TPA: 16S rRNA (guanine(527)-N(7))-methyltransferase RsmG [Solirubrobacteraceae bacterium]|nr:16S rRNA (guanine(527)-N(7))-methyltransferase RsmG [Solirubrobacteraceae bacterium]